MKRLLFLASAILAAAYAAAADVTFETRATSLAQALDAFSKANNVQVRATGPIARQVVVISVSKQPLEEFLKHLSSALSATIVQKDGVYEVSESATLIRAQEDAARARLAKSFAKSLAEQSKDLNDPPISEADLHKRITELKAAIEQIQLDPEVANNALYEKVQALNESMPTAQLVRRLLATIAPADLAAIPLNQRVVFATSPTRMQRQLGANAQRVMTQFVNEYSRMSSVIGRFPREQQEEFMGMMGGFFVKGEPAKVILSCIRYAGSNMSVEAQVLDRNGRVLATGSGNLSGNEDVGAEKNSVFEADKSEMPLKVSDESKTYFALTSRGIEGAKEGLNIVPEPLRTKVLSPEEHDPLGFGVTDLLLAAAADRKKPLIVVLPDTAQNFDISSNLKASELFTQLLVMDQVRMSLAEGWLVGQPVYPVETRILRVNRAAYGNLIRQIYKAKHVTLADLSAFAIAQGSNPGYESFFLQNMYSMFGRYLAGFDLSNWEGLRFYGFLGESMRRNMEGKMVAFQALPKEAQNEVARMIYGQSSLGVSFNLSSAPDMEVANDPMAGAMPCMDPTERLPNGIPQGAQVQLTTMDEVVLIPATGGFGVPMGASELASQVAMEERPDLFPWAQEAKLGDRFNSAGRVTMTFDFALTQGITHAVHLSDYRPAGTGEFTLKKLPDGFREQFEQLVKEMRESFKTMKPQDVRRHGGGPPPVWE